MGPRRSDARLNVELTTIVPAVNFLGLVNRETCDDLGPKLHLLKTKAPVLSTPPLCKEYGLVYGPEDVAGDSVWQFTGADSKTEGSQKPF